MLEVGEEKERSIIKRDLHISYKQPLGLGRTQGWRFWAIIIMHNEYIIPIDLDDIHYLKFRYPC